MPEHRALMCLCLAALSCATPTTDVQDRQTSPTQPQRLRASQLVRSAEDLLGVDLAGRVFFPEDPGDLGLDMQGSDDITPELISGLHALSDEAVGAWRQRVAGPPVHEHVFADGAVPHDCLLQVPSREDPYVLLYDDTTMQSELVVSVAGHYNLAVDALHRGGATGTSGVNLQVSVDGQHVCTTAIPGDHVPVELSCTAMLEAGPHVVTFSMEIPPPEDVFDQPPADCVATEAGGLSRLTIRGPVGDHGFGASCNLADADCRERVLHTAASRAWRRPAPASLVQRMQEGVQQEMSRGSSALDATAEAMRAVLLSPRFLLRVEPVEPGETRSLDDWELAARLSFGLWGTLPDATLRDCAAAGHIRTGRNGCGPRDQVTRMLAHPRASVFIEDYVDRWLGLSDLDHRRLPPELEPLRSAFIEETQLFVRTLLDEDRPLSAIADSTTTTRSDALRLHYGQSPDAGGWTPTTMSDPQRKGILGLASIQILTSDVDGTVPSRRGSWALERLLCDPVGLPPLQEPESDRSLGADDPHVNNPACASCHERLDPIGLPMEWFDHLGRRRADLPDADRSFPDGAPARQPQHVSSWLSAQSDLTRCVSRNLAMHVLDRAIEDHDLPSSPTWRAALGELVSSPAFTHRRAPEAP